MEPDEQLRELRNEVENLIAVLLLIEDNSLSRHKLSELGVTDSDFKNLKFYALKLLGAFIPKKFAS